MRKAITVMLMAGLVFATGAGLGRDAEAGVTVDLNIVGVNGATVATTSSILVGPSDVVTMALVFTNDEPLRSFAFAIENPAPADLSPIFLAQWFGTAIPGKNATFAPLVAGGQTILTFNNTPVAGTDSYVQWEGVNPIGTTLTLPAGSYQIGTVQWQATGAGASIVASVGPGGGCFDNSGLDCTGRTQYGTASILVPEPGTASLLGLGLVGLMLAGRRRRA